jgi:hypothetical protein
MQIQYKKDEYFHLNKNYLRGLTTSNIGRYIKTLKNGEFIDCMNYSAGFKYSKYKINPKFMSGILTLKLEKDSNLASRIIKNLYKKRAHYNRLEPHLRLMKDELMKMDMDYQKANKWIEINANDNQRLNYLTSINHIQDKRFRYFKRNKTNLRLDTNLTNLKSDLRQFIKGDYVSIDLKNSQPFLLGVLIDSIINNRDTLCSYLHSTHLFKTYGIKRIKQVLKVHQKQEKAEMVKLRLFYNSVCRGSLYDDFIKCYDDEISRDDAKKIMFKVLFSRNEYYLGYKKTIPYENDKKTFSSVYPFVAEVVKELKRKDHKTLPIYLQRLESYLFIDCIAKELVNNGIIPFTIHDSVIVKREYYNRTIDIMNGVFMKQLGVIPSFEVKNLNDSHELKPKSLGLNFHSI